MDLDSFYIDRIRSKKRGNADVYKKVIIDIFGKEISWDELVKANRAIQIEIMIRLEDEIAFKKSPLDIKKLSRVIQESRSGVGGCAITNFKCAFCGKEESWSNTAVPRICTECADRMAENIVRYSSDRILKDKEEKE